MKETVILPDGKEMSLKEFNKLRKEQGLPEIPNLKERSRLGLIENLEVVFEN